MNLLFPIFLCFAFTVQSCHSLSAIEFDKYVEPMCFKLNDQGVPLVNGQVNPLASTLENFIALAEKFEQANPLTGIKEELFYFIRNYTYTNIEYNKIGDIVRWNPTDSVYDDVDKLWEQDDNKRNSLPNVNDPFTDEEKCSLYFMISHSIVRTRRDVQVQRAPIPNMQNNTSLSTKKPRWGSEIAHDDAQLYPQEHGVVAIQGTEEAVSLGRVLTGMYVGLNPGRKVDISSFTRIPREYLPVQEAIVDPLFILTIAEVIAMATWRPEVGLREKLARNGYWRSIPVGSDIETKDVCPMVYKLDDNSQNAYSYSSMRGAADGLILGTVSGVVEAKKRDVKLSQVLRQYYSRGGLNEKIPDVGDIRATFCNREALINTWDSAIKDQVHNFLLLASKSYKNIEDSLKFAWDKYTSEKQQLGIFRNMNKEIKDYCGAVKSEDKPEDLPLETPLDVIAVLETSSSEENFKKEQLIIGSLAKRLQLSYTGSRMTIFTDQKVSPPSVSVPDTIYLKKIVDETYSPAVAACHVTQITADPSGSIPDEDVIIAIHQYLNEKSKEESKHSGTKGKVIILFNFDEDLPVGRPSSSQLRLEKALRQLFLDFQDVYIYALGKNPEVLKKYARNDASYVMNAFDVPEDEVANLLYDKIISAPARLQYSDCSEAKSERSAVFENFITPNAVQHWAMPARYFYKSFDLKFGFESSYGEVKVCHSRSTVAPELQKESCQNIGGNGKAFEIKHSNPCKGFSEHSCAPFYFSFIGLNATDGKDVDYCDDKNMENKCRTLDQIKFKISHEGIRCSGCLGIMAAPLCVLFALILSHLFFKIA